MSDDLEQRLSETLRAYADLVDAPDVDTLPGARARPRPVPRRWRGALLAAVAAAAVVVGSLVVVDVRHPGAGSAAGVAAAPSRTDRTPTEAPESESGTAADQALAAEALPPSPQLGVPYRVDLVTHCGVRGIDIGGVWFAADPALVEEYGPPPGWGNPVQPGTLTLLSATAAVFTDHAGHRVQLRADEAARPEPCD